MHIIGVAFAASMGDRAGFFSNGGAGMQVDLPAPLPTRVEAEETSEIGIRTVDF